MIEYEDPCPDVMDDAAPSPAAIEFRLCNFPTSHWDLLPEHRTELHHKILDSSWPHGTGWIDLIGFASRLGWSHDTPGNNLNLSRARCAAVQTFLSSGLPRGFRFNVIEGEGDTQSQGGSLDAGFYRAVEVRLFAQNYRPAPWTKKRQPTPHHASPSNRFRFDPISLNSGSFAMAQEDVLLFRITDLTNGQSRYFKYHGIGLGLSPIPASKSSGWDSPDHSEFETKFAIRDLAEFDTAGAAAVLGQAGISVSTPWGSKGPSGLEFSFAPEAYSRRGISQDLDFTFGFSKGFGVSAGVSGTKGTVTIQPASYTPGPPGWPIW